MNAWQETDKAWQGLHLFSRYRTENDLYVASLRQDGSVSIKRKLCGRYRTLAHGMLRDANGNTKPFNTRTWYRLKFSTIGDVLTFSVDNVEQLQVIDPTFSWGTNGLRIDYANAYVDDWRVD